MNEQGDAKPVEPAVKFGVVVHAADIADRDGAKPLLVPLTAPEVRRLLLLLTRPPGEHGFRLQCSC
ncbi:MAG: hypothetical protein H0W06_03885 [Chloroflexia bacterium]|nr:hypothetical protein [Chloroflexia bacterium]